MRYTILFLILTLISCSTKNPFVDKVYVYSDDYKIVKLKFQNDSIAVLNYSFNCKHLDVKYKHMQDTMIYRIEKERIIVTNLECRTLECEFPLNKEIPILEDETCFFLGKEFREERHRFDGRSYSSEFEKHGRIPNIDVDTIYYVKKDLLMLYKQGVNGSLGFFLNRER